MQERKAAATRGREWEYVLVFLCHCKRRRVAESSFDRRGRGGISIPQRRGEVTSSDLTPQQQLVPCLDVFKKNYSQRPIHTWSTNEVYL